MCAEKIVHVCPELSSFRHVGKCPIHSCQFCSKITPTGCLARDRKETSDRAITSEEISHYKTGLVDLGPKPDQSVRRSIAKARNLMALYCYLSYILENVSEDVRTYRHVYNISALVDQVHTYLKETFDLEYRDWMLPHVSDALLFSAFMSRTGSLSYSDVSLAASLGLTPKKFMAFQEDVTRLSDPEETDFE